MEITTHCTGCGRPFVVPERFAGRVVRCKHCLTHFEIPTPRPRIDDSVPAAPEPVPAPPPPVAKMVYADGSSSSSTGAGVVRGRGRSAAAAVVAAPQDDPFDVLARLDPEGGAPAPPSYEQRPAPKLPSFPSSGRRRGKYGRATPQGYVSFPGDEKFDQFVPPAAMLAYVIYCLWMFTRVSELATAMGGSGGAVSVLLVVMTFLTFLILVPMSLLGPFVAGRVMNFDLPENPYLRMCAVVALSTLAQAWMTGGALPTKRSAGATDAIVVPLVTWLGAFWVMFRLQPAQFVLSVVLGLVFLVVGIFLFAVALGILAAVVGFSAGAFGKLGAGAIGSSDGAGYTLSVDVGPSVEDSGKIRSLVRSSLERRLNAMNLDRRPGQPYRVEASISVIGSDEVQFRRFGDPGGAPRTMTVDRLRWELNVFDRDNNAVSRARGNPSIGSLFIPGEPEAYNAELAKAAHAELAGANIAMAPAPAQATPASPTHVERQPSPVQPQAPPGELEYVQVEARLPVAPPAGVARVGERAREAARAALARQGVRGDPERQLRVVVGIEQAGRESVSLRSADGRSQFTTGVDTLRVQVDVHDRYTNRLLRRGSAVVDDARTKLSETLTVEVGGGRRVVVNDVYHAALWERALQRIEQLELLQQP